MAVKGEIQIWNHENTQLEGPEPENGSSRIVEFSHSAYQPYDEITFRIQGSVRVEAFSITKELDKLSPILFGIATKGIICKKVVITLYQINQQGGGSEEPYYTFTMHNVRIARIRNHMELILDKDLESLGHLEELHLIAEQHERKFLDGGVEVLYPDPGT